MYDGVTSDFLLEAPLGLVEDVLWLIEYGGLIDSCAPGSLDQLREALADHDSGLVVVPVSLARHLGIKLEIGYRRGVFDTVGERSESLLRLELEIADRLDREFRLPPRTTVWSPNGILPTWFTDEMLVRGVKVKSRVTAKTA